MIIADAYNALENGEKLTHPNLAPIQWVKMNHVSGKIVTSTGRQLTLTEFFKDKAGEHKWSINWMKI